MSGRLHLKYRQGSRNLPDRIALGQVTFSRVTDWIVRRAASRNPHKPESERPSLCLSTAT